MDQLFTKSERLSSLKAIGELFSKQNGLNPSFLIFPYKVVFKKIPTDTTDPQLPSILISVSKKRFKKAVDRNKIKRLTREAYRKNKSFFSNQYNIALIYVGNEIIEFTQIEKSIIKCLKKIEKEY